VTEEAREQKRRQEVVRTSRRSATWLAWLLWILLAALGSATVAPYQLDWYVLTHPFNANVNTEWLSDALGQLIFIFAIPAYATVGAVVATLRPKNAVGWLCLALSLLLVLVGLPPGLGALGIPWYVVDSIQGLAWHLMVPPLPVTLMLLVFPEGRLPSHRWWAVVGIAVVGYALTVLEAYLPYSPGAYAAVESLVGIGVWVSLAALVASAAAVVLRWRRRREQERQQIKWLAYMVALTAIAGLGVVITGYVWGPFSYAKILPTAGLVAGVGLGLPAAICVAILRYRLYDIDLLINRTLVYGALTASVVGVYVLVVGGLGVLLQSRGNPAVSLLAAAVIAMLFQPLRSRLQRGVNRLMYGERDDPYAVISRLGRRLEATIAPESVLPTITETIAQALKLPYAAILLKEGESFRTAAAYGSPTGEPETLPLVYQREEVGRLVFSPRAPGEEFSAADRRLLEDLARQAEVAVHAVRLTADLQRSRERLVATREEERRRLRRDLHDGIGPTLTGLALQLNAAHKLVMGDEPKDAGELLTRLEERTEITIAEMRRLIYGLRPPALDDLGLIPSIRQQAQSQGMVDLPAGTKMNERSESRPIFSMETPGDLPLLPAAVEVAAYRIAQEALTNVARHAGAKTCQVRLSVDEAAGALGLEVIDDGVGMPEDRVAGVGLSSMRERAEELGGTLTIQAKSQGGTRVLVHLPLPTSGEHPEGARSSWSAPSAS
jgi:signal transduction histidine kinase